ncbi:MAG: hypothetical protein II710_05820 [Clostridia bacterium]|nr:hypothetical protein [Clostridia bacterium]
MTRLRHPAALLKICLLLLIVCLLLGHGQWAIHAVDDDDVEGILVIDCDSPMSGSELDTAVKTQGTASASKTFNPSQMSADGQGQHALIFQYKLETPIDVSSTDTFTFDFYASDVGFLKHIGKKSGQFEVTSSGTCDHEEQSWIVGEVLKDIKPGWNHLVLSVSNAGFVKTRFNFFRMYIWFEAGEYGVNKDYTIKLDNMRFKSIDYKTVLSKSESLSGIRSSKRLSLDTENKYEGEACLKYQINPLEDSFVDTLITFDRGHNIEGCTMLEFYLYISNPQFVKTWNYSMTVELGSGDPSAGDFYRWAVGEVILMPLEVGWNLVKLTTPTAEIHGEPSKLGIDYFRLIIEDIETEIAEKTTIRIDTIIADLSDLNMHLGPGAELGLESISNGREYDDDDTIYLPPEETETSEDPEDPGELETDPEDPETETQPTTEPKETEKDPAESETTVNPGTMLDDADAELNQNTYNTDHAKVVAALVASALFAATSALVAVFVVLKIKKGA